MVAGPTLHRPEDEKEDESLKEGLVELGGVSRVRPRPGEDHSPGEVALLSVELPIDKVSDAAEEDAPQEQPGKLQKARDLLGAVQRADFSQRNVLRGVNDGRYKFVRFFAINEHNHPETVGDLYRDNDVALYDLLEDPDEMINLADPENPEYDEALVMSMNGKLEALIGEELGPDPNLVKRPLETFVVGGLKSRRK